MKKAALHNLGCKVNAYETEAMQQLLEEDGYEIVPFDQCADVYIINTCSVTNIADRKSRQMLHRARKRNPDAVIVAAGCYVQTAAESLKESLAADILIGNNRKKDLPSILARYMEERSHSKLPLTDVCMEDISKEREYEPLGLTRTAEHTRAYIKVQDGCNQFCSYCIIPYARGRVRSRSLEDILKEIRTLSDQGYREAVLTGIHLSSYGMDFSKSEGKSIDFAENTAYLLELLEKAGEIPGIQRIRLGSLEPRIITEEFVAALSRMPKICPHFHLSLQSGCDETLQRMNRKYSTEQYLHSCEILRKYFRDPALTTDLIVGFPGETEEEFEKTYSFVKRVSFYETHVFKYSVRQGTRAAAMKEQIPDEIKTRRSARLLELSEQKKREYEKRFEGREAELLVEEKIIKDGVSLWIGHTREYIKGAVKAAPGGSDCPAGGSLIRGVVGETIRFL